ncbi:uncharacterized protein LOC112258524 [Oncorhynchus tshawytscha]|uniref:uncharacterized protein LOC112258524 n=1 Tax=Oncorhynchus tshawytscha TaxID=74940 RepID=UPI001C3D7F61|nr:uncharacterized protein LOC112258524 [Oncorhynchus tshawytscha]
MKIKILKSLLYLTMVYPLNVLPAVTSQIRLVNGKDRCSGRVEIYYSGQWGTVCDDSWDIKDAEVVCRQLDCGVTNQVRSSGQYGPGSGTIWLDDVACTGSERHLTECPHRGFGIHNCHHSEDAGVVCPVFFHLQAAEVRLVDGKGRCSGRVEIYHSGQWGTVCDDDWDMNDAAVVCGQLGCGSAVGAPLGAHFGQGSEPTWLDNVNCSGSESYLSECSHRSFGVEDCNHGEDAGVFCLSGLTLKRPTLSRTPSHSAFSPGETAQFICSVPQRIPISATFALYMGGSSIMTKAVGTTQTSKTFTLSSLQSAHQGWYSCLQQITQNGQKMISSSSSNSMDITIVVLLQPNISLNAPNGGMFWGLQGPEVTRGHSFSITCSIQPQYPGGLFYLDFSGSNRTETEPAVNHSASFHFPVAEYTDQGNYSCVYEVNVSTLSFHSTKTELLTVGIRASIVPIITPGAICGLLLLLLLFIPCLVWKKISSRDQSIMINPRETSEENDEEDYVNVEAFVNKRKDEDLKKGCHARMYVKRELLTIKNNENAPGSMNKCGNNQGEGPESSEEDESDYENADIITERDFAEDIYDEDSESLDLELLTSCKSGRENDYEEDDNIYANNE